MEMVERGYPSLEKMEFSDLGDGKTMMKSTTVFLSKEDCDGMVENGMEEGWRQSIEALEEVLTK